MCYRRSTSGGLQAKSRGRKCSIGWSRSNDPGRKGPLGAIKTDGNTDPFQLGRGGEVRSLDEVSRDPVATQDQTTWPYRLALVSSTSCGHSTGLQELSFPHSFPRAQLSKSTAPEPLSQGTTVYRICGSLFLSCRGFVPM